MAQTPVLIHLRAGGGGGRQGRPVPQLPIQVLVQEPAGGLALDHPGILLLRGALGQQAGEAHPLRRLREGSGHGSPKASGGKTLERISERTQLHRQRDGGRRGASEPRPSCPCRRRPAWGWHLDLTAPESCRRAICRETRAR